MAAIRLRHAVVVLFALALLTLPALHADENLMYGKTDVITANRTDEGRWEGTWYYVSKARTMAIWMTEDDGEIKLKLKLRDPGVQGQAFTTDWQGKADYDIAGVPGKFALEFDQIDENVLSGEWTWDYGLPSNNKSERAKFTVYRGGHGRQMVWLFTDVVHKYGGAREYETRLSKLAWTFNKASRYQALWNELPF